MSKSYSELSGQGEAVCILLKKGTDANLKDNRGKIVSSQTKQAGRFH